MTKIKEKIAKLIALRVQLAALAFAVGLGTSAWAATPLAVWNGDFNAATTRNGVTFDANGNTVAQDGSSVEIGSSSAVGVKFSTSTAYKYIQVVFTVSDLDEDAASDRALVQTYSGTTSEGGVYLKGGTIDTSGINVDAKWTSTNPVSDDSLSSYSEDESTERTYAVECAHSSSTTWGLHLYELGSGARSVVFGSSKANGLRYGTTYDCVTLGGKLASSSNFAAMPGLKIKKVAIYASDSDFPLDATAMSGYVFPGSSVVASGETTSISALNTAAPVWTLIQSGATVTLDAEPSSNVLFAGSNFSMSGSTVTAADGVTLDLANTTLTSLTLDLGTTRTLPTVNNVGSVPVTVILTEASGDSGSIAITGGSDDYTYKVRKSGRFLPATYSSGTLTYAVTATTAQTITLTADTTLSSLLATIGDVGDSSCSLTITDDGSDHVLTVDYDMATGSITFTGSGTTTLAIANGATFTAGTTFANSGTGSVIVRVDAGGTADINAVANSDSAFLTTPTKFVLNGGSLVNNGANIAETSRQITTLELTADSTVGGTSAFGLIGSNYGATTLTLNGHTVTVNITGGNVSFYVNSVLTDDGLIKIKQGVFNCRYNSGYSVRQNTFNCTIQLDNDYYNEHTDVTYAGATYGYCEFFMPDNSQPVVKNIFGTGGRGGSITGAAATRILNVTGTLGLPYAGTITPNVTLHDGATIKALTAGGAPIPAYGITIGESSTIYVDVSEIVSQLSGNIPIFTWASGKTPNGTFVFTDTDLQTRYELTKKETGLYVSEYVMRATVTEGEEEVTRNYSTLNDALAAIDAGGTVEILTDDTEVSSATLSKNATIAAGENSVTLPTLNVSANATLTITGSGTFAIGAITGDGTLSLDASAFTGTLSIPVGTTIYAVNASTSIAVTGTVAGQTVDAEGNISNGDTLFTLTSGTYAQTVVGSDYGDIHYTLDGTSYKAGKTFWWNGSGSADTERVAIAAKWETDAGKTQTATFVPTLFDTAVFDKSGCSVKIDDSMPYNICVKVDTSLYSNPSSTGHTFVLGTNAVDTVLVVLDGVTAKLSQTGNKNSNKYEIYSALLGSGRLQCAASNSSSQWSGVDFKGDTSGFSGIVDLSQVRSDQYNRINAASATDNSNARWFISTNGTYTSASSGNYTPFMVSGTSSASQTYKFGVLRGYASNNSSCGKYLAFELGENIDEDSWLKGSWYSKTAQYGATVKWLAATATFTNAVANAYEVQLLEGGNVYIEKDATTANRNIPSLINFTDNGGYLTIDDDNAAIAADILGAVNTTTAGVGLNVTTTDALTIAAPTALQTGIDWKKKGAQQVSLTGVTSAGTVTVAAGAGALILPANTTYTLGTDTVVDAGYTAGIKFVNVAQATALLNGTTYYTSNQTALSAFQTGIASDETTTLQFLDDTTLSAQEIEQLATGNIYWNATSKTLSKAIAKIGATTYGSLAAAVTDATASGAATVSISLLRASSEAVTLDAKTTVTEASAGLYTGTLSGAGTLTLAGTREAALTFDNWTGTVVLPAITATEYLNINGFNFNFYGVAGSTVKLSEGVSGVWFVNAAVNPAVEIPADKTLTVSSFSPSFANAFTALKGAGAFAITATANNDNDLANAVNWGEGYEAYSAYFLVGDVSEFSGNLYTTSDVGIAIGSAKPGKNTVGGKIWVRQQQTANGIWTAPGGIVLGEPQATLTVADGASVTTDPAISTSEAASYVKSMENQDDSVTYSVETYKTVTFVDEDGTTVLQTVGNLELGDTPTYTEATPTKDATAQYTYTFAGWTPAIAAVTGDATYTATYTSTVNQYTLTIPEVEHATATVTVDNEATDVRTFDYGTAVVVTWTADATYKIESGATQNITINGAVTAAEPTVVRDVVTITIPAVTGATPAVTASTGTVTYNGNGTWTVQAGATITVTWSNDGAYVITNSSTEFVANTNVTVGTDAGALPTATSAVAQDSADVYYADLASAIAGCPANGTVTLLADITADATKTTAADRLVVTKAITIDFGAYIYSVPGSLEPTDNWSAFYIDADVTVTGTTGGVDCLDKVAPDSGCGVYAFNVRNGAKLTINGGAYHGGGTIAQAQLGTVAVTGGTFTITPFPDPYGSNFAFNCVDSAYAAGTAGVSISGGTFTGFDPQENASEGAATDFTADGYVAILDNGAYVVQEGYNVTFINEDATVLETHRVVKGENVAYDGATPTKEATAQYTYTFAGWTPEVVSTPVEDATYTATFTSTVNEYTITWNNDDGSTIDTTTVAYGTTPTHADAAKTADAQYTYTFAGWTPTIAAVTGAATYTATYTSTVNQYTLTVPTVANATAAVTVGGVTQTATSTTAEASVYTFNYGTEVTVTWTAAATYKITSGATQVITLTANTIAENPTVELDTKTFTVVVPANTTVTVTGATDNGDGSYTATIGNTVTITYAADGAYVAGGTQSQRITVGADTESIAAPIDYTTAAAVAQIGTTYYASLAAAVAAAQANDTVALLADVAAERTTISKSLTLDLGGKTLTGRVTIDNGTVTVQNGTIAGRFDAYDDSVVTLAATATVSGQVVVWGDGTYGQAGCKTPTLNINGTIITTGEYDAIFTSSDDASHPVVNINAGSTVTAETMAVRMSAPGGVLTMNGGEIDSDKWGVFVTGGSTFTMNGGSIEFGEGGFGVGNHGNDTVANGTDTVITIAGGTISGPDTAVYHPGEGTLNITGGTITGTTGVEVRAGTLNIPSTSTAVITATGAFDESANGSGATVTGAAVAISQHTTNNPIAANIQGGTFRSTGDAGVAFYVTDTVNADPTEVAATVSGGTFYAPVVVADSAADVGTIIPATSTARFSDAAADGVAAGYTLVAVENTDPVVYEVAALAGIQYFYTWSVANVFYFNDEDPIPVRTTQATVPKIKRTGESAYHAAEDWVTINWTVTASDATDASTPDDTIATVDDSGLVTFTAPGTVKLWLTMTDPSGATKSASKTVKYASAPAYVVSADGETRTAYSSLYAAFNGAATGEKIVLGADAAVSNIARMTLSNGRALTLDLAGHTVTCSVNFSGTGSIFNIQSGSLSVVDTAATKGGIAATGNGGRVFSMETADNATTALSIGEGVNISSAKEVCVYLQGAATLTTAGNLTAASDFAICGNGAAGNGGTTVNVTGGTVTGDEIAIYQPQNGALNISGGTITGGTAVYVKSGTVTVTGGTLAATGSAADYAYNGSGANATGDALVIDNCGYPGGEPEVSITGGTFTSQNGKAVASCAKDENYDAVSGFVSGGSFSSAVAEDYCAEGFIPEDNGDGTYGVKEGVYVAEVAGGAKYESLADAIANCPANGTVKVISAGDPEDPMEYRMAIDSTIIIDKSMTIDLNGFYLIAEDCRVFWIKSGDVTITSTSDASAVAVMALSSEEEELYDIIYPANFAESSSVIRVGDAAVNSTPAKLTLDGMVNVVADYCYGVTVFGKNDDGVDGADIELVVRNGATVATTGNMPAISGNGTNNLKPTAITIDEGGVVDATYAYAIYHPGKGTLVVNGTVTGDGGIEIKSGTLTIGEGAVVEATAEEQSHTLSNNGTSTSGYVIAAVGNPAYVGDPAVEITGGTITGTIIALSDTGSEEVGATIAVSGGEFSEEVPAAYCAAGYEPAELEGGKYGVQTAKVVVEIDVTPTTTEPVTVLVAVPKACTAATLIDTTNRSAGDILKVYDKTDKCFYTWELASPNGTWTPLKTFKVDGSGTTTSEKIASEVNIAAGQSVWVTVTTDEDIMLLVSYNAEPIEVSVDKGWNLVAPTTPGGTTVNEIIESLGETIAQSDAIVVPSVNNGAPKIYNYVNGAWGYDDVEYETRTIRGQEVKVAKPVRKTADTEIPAGTGVWFVNGGTSPKEINL